MWGFLKPKAPEEEGVGRWGNTYNGRKEGSLSEGQLQGRHKTNIGLLRDGSPQTVQRFNSFV